MFLDVSQVTIVEKADSSNVLPSPLSISTKNRMTFLFANLKDRDFLVQRISDFLQQTTSKIHLERELTGSLNSSDDEVGIIERFSPEFSIQNFIVLLLTYCMQFYLTIYKLWKII